MEHQKYKPSTCPRCGELFTCCLFKHCWCEDVELSEDEITHMQLQYVSCLCEKCLLEVKRELKNK